LVTNFSATFDSKTKLISALVFLMLLPILRVTHSVAAGYVAALVFLLSYAYSPQRYILSDRSLTIVRLIGNVHIALDHVQQVRPVRTGDLKWGIRLWGSGGLFGYYGLYRTAELGKCTWYVTDRSKCVVVITGEKTVVVSPEDVDGFVAAIRVPDYTQK
jgi:hypothetical protein